MAGVNSVPNGTSPNMTAGAVNDHLENDGAVGNARPVAHTAPEVVSGHKKGLCSRITEIFVRNFRSRDANRAAEEMPAQNPAQQRADDAESAIRRASGHRNFALFLDDEPM